MKMYARLENNVVRELFTTDSEISTLFHPSLVWADVTGHEVQVNWIQVEDGGFVAPPLPEPGLVMPRLADLAAEIADLRATLGQLRHPA